MISIETAEQFDELSNRSKRPVAHRPWVEVNETCSAQRYLDRVMQIMPCPPNTRAVWIGSDDGEYCAGHHPVMCLAVTCRGQVAYLRPGEDPAAYGLDEYYDQHVCVSGELWCRGDLIGPCPACAFDRSEQNKPTRGDKKLIKDFRQRCEKHDAMVEARRAKEAERLKAGA